MNYKVQDFYSKIQFPGHYTKEGLDYYKDTIKNPYLNLIDNYIQKDDIILDVGCGTGLISNLFASKYKDSRFVGVDFSDSIDYAKQYANDNDINNVEYVKIDYTENEIDELFDVVICQGVLHHIPEYKYTAQKLMKNVKDGGYLIVGLYHPWGKVLKRWVSLNYKNRILHLDQEENPFELSFTVNQSLSLFPGYKLINSYPAINIFTSINALLNYKNGGLITFILQKK